MGAATLLLAACVLLVAPTCHATSCYQCADLALLGLQGAGGAGTLLGFAAEQAHFPPCSEFDAADSRFKTQCAESVSDQKSGCMKTSKSGATMRGCQDVVPVETCQVQGEMTACMCMGDYCNGVGLQSPTLLLLLSAAMLAALFTA